MKNYCKKNPNSDTMEWVSTRIPGDKRGGKGKKR
jgi:hypothetical protein